MSEEEAEKDDSNEEEEEKEKEKEKEEKVPVAQEVQAPTAAAPAPPFEKAKKHLVFACGAIALGLAVAGSLDRTTGGVILLIGWLTAVAALHRLGRAGSERRGVGRAVGARASGGGGRAKP